MNWNSLLWAAVTLGIIGLGLTIYGLWRIEQETRRNRHLLCSRRTGAGVVTTDIERAP